MFKRYASSIVFGGRKVGANLDMRSRAVLILLVVYTVVNVADDPIEVLVRRLIIRLRSFILHQYHLLLYLVLMLRN